MTTLIKNGTIINGTGSPPFKGSITITHDRITNITTAPIKNEQQYNKVIDATDRFVTPGFIDAHSHTDLANFVDQGLKPKIMQGVTTEVSGQCGLGVAPISEKLRPQLRHELIIGNPPINWQWESCQEYYTALKKEKLESNLLPFIGHGIVRYSISQNRSDPLSPNQLQQLQEELRTAFEAGAAGLSLGLIYLPALYANRVELSAALQTTAKYNRPVAIHLRSESDELLEALQEIIILAEECGCQLHISHLKTIGQRNEAKATKALQLIDKHKLTFDQYPYPYGSTTLFSILPPSLFSANSNPRELLSQPEIRKQIKALYTGKEKPPAGAPWDNLPLLLGWENIIVANIQSKKNSHLIGKTIQQIAELRSCDPTDVALDLLQEEQQDVRMIDIFSSEKTVEQILKHPRGVVGSDTLLGGMPHPRVFGTFARIIQRYVFEKKLLTIEEAIAKISGNTAHILHIKERGTLEPGNYADIAVFNKQFSEQATLTKPAQYVTGLEQLFINGHSKIIQGQYQPARPGRLLIN